MMVAIDACGINPIMNRSYLENFGYLKKGQPEMANLLLGDVAQSYEDDFRIAIKTLQEFGGIPVTGEIDEATRELIKKKRCGRPDREEGDIEGGRRKKRFAVQGEKWKYTNLTWRQVHRRSFEVKTTAEHAANLKSSQSPTPIAAPAQFPVELMVLAGTPTLRPNSPPPPPPGAPRRTAPHHPADPHGLSN
ncbi:Matrix metalloproteinase-16 [Papilio xuthus]|uniref:Matrix metalloproteinase-16 n=1 Tax=Papilio xuthus TaxID=66420 RepID=A0A194PQM8_PAPXU|nr:Matrix metalloproteinase-16 [Papilio xuthus]